MCRLLRGSLRCLLDSGFPPLYRSGPGLAIFTLQGSHATELRKLPQWFYRLRWLAIFSKHEVRKLDVFQMASNVSFHQMAFSKNHPNLVEIGVRKKNVNMWKLKLREQIVLIRVLRSDSQGKTLSGKKAVKNASGSGRQKWPSKFQKNPMFSRAPPHDNLETSTIKQQDCDKNPCA